MKKLLFIFLLTIPIKYSTCYAQDTPAEKGLRTINRDVIGAQLEFLASDWMEGRKSGEKGERISSDYIASMLRLYGVKPYGDIIDNLGDRSYFQNFNLIRTTATPDQTLMLLSSKDGLEKTTVFANNIDFVVRPSSSTETKAGIIFTGYGFISRKLGFDDLGSRDVMGKFILRITGNPAFALKELSRAEIAAAKKEFENIALEKGAAGIIDVNPELGVLGSSLQQLNDMSPSEKTPRPYQVYSNYNIPGENNNSLIRIAISMNAAREILSGTGNSFEEYLKKADQNEHYDFLPIIQKSIILRTNVMTESVPVRNILGLIEGINKEQNIVLGAHYDHMGMNNGYIWNGADDNGSGTVGVMTLAKALMETGKKPEKSIIIALWTAEEEGLLGSEYFVRNLPFPREQIRLNVNFDMISRYVSEDQKNKAVMTYSSSEKGFREMTAANLRKYGIELDVEYQPSDNPPGGSDHRSFVAAGIPVMRFKPGHREEYHTPKDEISTIDWDIMEKIIRISFANIWQLADSNW